MVEEIVHDPTHGPLALESELPENKEPLSTLDLLLREFADDTPCAFTEVRT